MSIENPNLEQQKIDLMSQIQQDQQAQEQIINQILRTLQTTHDVEVLLSDVVLVNQLQSSQKKSRDFQQRINESKQNEEQINSARNKYRALATQGQMLYFSILELRSIDYMYQYSLEKYKQIFVKALQNDSFMDIKQFELKLKNMSQVITETIFTIISMSLFERHKLLFSFLICLKMHAPRLSVTKEEWEVFLHTDTTRPTDAPCPVDFIPSFQWIYIAHQLELAQKISKYANLAKKIFADTGSRGLFNAFYHSQSQYTEAAFFKLLGIKNGFEKLTIIKIFRPDQLIKGIQYFLSEELGGVYVAPPSANLGTVFQYSDFDIPIIFILTQGSDHRELLLKFAEERAMQKKINIIALGQGQGEKAIKMMTQAQKRGEWILLENCHLAESWMPSLDRFTQQLQKQPNSQYR